MTEVRIPKKLYDAIRSDLDRPHPFALERAGFVFGKLADESSRKPLIVLYRYAGLTDYDYVDDPNYAACFSGDVIRRTMQELRDKRSTSECAFHIHVHEHRGKPGFSKPDLLGLPPIIPSFSRAAGDGAHGMILLSDDHAISMVWLPGQAEPVLATHITVVGKPLKVWVNKWNRD